MATYLDFESTKRYRNFILGKTLTVPNGPQDWNRFNYIEQSLNSFSNQDLGDVDDNREEDLSIPQTHNIYKPDEYFIIEELEVLPRRANLNLYPYFETGLNYSIISIMTSDNYDTESELFKFAASYIKEDENGPVHARIQQNLYTATVGRVRLIDALNGNGTTAINLITGREPLVELNNKITVAKTLPGKGIDFLQTVIGTEFPWSEIPGHYLSDPRYTVYNRTEGNALVQDITGNLGELIGIQRRPKMDRKPSDLFIEYLGEGVKQRLFDNLSYSKYAPDYTTTARSQNSSKIFAFIDNVVEKSKEILGLEAPKGMSYIGDDRGNDVKHATIDFNDRPVKSNYYLSLLFDPVQAKLNQGDKNITDGGLISGKLTWISSKSKNYPNINSPGFNDTLSTRFTFKDNSILGLTKQILESMPSNSGEARSHVANAIDQTSRVFKEGDIMISRGSAITSVYKLNGVETGAEYCRVWTKDSPYMSNQTLIRNNKLLRKFESSVLTNPYNINIYPNSDGNTFNTSTNIVKGKGDGFYAKKYMFSIENLAWRTSNTPGFTYNDLPYCERGNMGGRVMWFPPYDLKVEEQNSADWEENTFLGRPEPVYTYQQTKRSGSISFKVVVDHPSILNLLVKKHFANMSEAEADSYINAFFSGCYEVDFYDLIRSYPTLTQSDIQSVMAYLGNNKDEITAKRLKVVLEPTEDANTPETESSQNDDKIRNTIPTSFTHTLFFDNDVPKSAGSTNMLYSNEDFDKLSNSYLKANNTYITKLNDGINKLTTYAVHKTNIPQLKNDTKLLFYKEILEMVEIENSRDTVINAIKLKFNEFGESYSKFNENLIVLKEKLKNNEIKEIQLTIISSTSEVADTSYNLKLSYRRSHSIILYILNMLKNDGVNIDFNWQNENVDPNGNISEEIHSPISFKDLGYENLDGSISFTKITNQSEYLSAVNGNGETIICAEKKFNTTELKITSPTSFFCRQSIVNVDFFEYTKDEKYKTIPKTEYPKRNIISEDFIPTRKPPLDEIKRIIMKTLSECYYFKQMEETTPAVFSSLKEKLKYFHPAFHSMTPEGLNTRLTFLQQCIRPGDTIPIKGINNVNDLNARNTSFGPPPICILRIGDFFHSKVIIRDVNISYDEGLWDLNPEGIGIQPMIANVTLQVSFIGGHGLEKPVERLQNALSSNFYANTEMYDYRSTATEDRTKLYEKEFSKECLEEMSRQLNPEVVPDTNTNSKNIVTNGDYIGTINGDNVLNYDNIIKNVFDLTKEYYNNYVNSFSNIVDLYGYKIASLFYSPEYRTIIEFDYNTDSQIKAINLFGEYPKQKEIIYYLNNFKTIILKKIDDTNISILMGLDEVLNDEKIVTSELHLKPFVRDFVNQFIDNISSTVSIDSIINSRNNLIQNLDKLNFIVSTGADGQITEDNIIGAILTDIDTASFYGNYSSCIDYQINNHSKLTSMMYETYDFSPSNTSMSDNELSDFLSVFLRGEENSIIGLYDDVFKNTKVNRISKVINNFMAKITPPEIKLEKFPELVSNAPVDFSFTEENDTFSNEEIEELTKIHSSYVELGVKLNFYKP